MTIKELLQLESIKGSRVVTKNTDLNVIVSGVNVMEVPDIINWVKKGEFLMTTGYSYRNKQEAFVELIPQLAKKGIATLGIKTRRYFEQIPESLISKAEECGLTVIEMDESVVFSNVVREVIESSISEEYESVSGMLDQVTSLSEIILSGNGLENFIAKLSEYLGNPVILVRENGECIISGMGSEDAYIPENNEDVIYQNPGEKQGWYKLMIGVKEYRVYYYNIIQKKEQLASIHLIEKNQSIENYHVHLIEQCSYMVGMELISESVRKKVEMRYIDQFLQNWILGKIENENSLKMQSDVYGIEVPMEKYEVVLLKSNKENSPEQNKAVITRLRKNLKEYRNVFVTGINNQILIVLPIADEAEYTVRIMELSDNILGGDAKTQLCVGKEGNAFYNLYESYKDAVNIAKVSERYKLKERILKYQDTGVYSLLYLIPIGRELDEYLNIYVRPLIKYDEKHQTDMYNTLKIYLGTKGNAKATAELLFMHYNTIGYRLERISHILKMDISRHEVQFCLNMAIKIYDMYL